LKQAGLVEDRRTGKSSLYKLKAVEGSSGRILLTEARQQIPEAEPDQSRHAPRGEKAPGQDARLL
jgi:hypothetical protein